jgi:uncharacterized membrane protein
MFVVFPLGLLATAVIFDVLYLVTGNPGFPTASFYMIAAGVLGGLTAAVFGFMDWLGLPKNSRARRVGAFHGIGNFIIVVLFAVSWLLRQPVSGHVPGTAAMVLSFAGAGLALITGWLGGELVYRLRVGVDPGAQVNAPSSLSDEPAGANVRRANR